MNKKQMAVLLSAVILFGLSELFPPLSYKDEQSRTRSAGYHFFYNPPTTVEIPNKMSSASPRPDEQTRHFRVGRDRVRLFGQRIILLFLMLGLLLLTEKRRTKLKAAFGVLSLSFGCGVLGLYGYYILTIG